MLRNNNGYFLLELLLSLSALFMICIFFVPLLVDIRNQLMSLEVEKKARQMVFEELEASLNGTQAYINNSTIQNGMEYRIFWRDSTDGSKKEVCVSVDETVEGSKTEICGILE